MSTEKSAGESDGLSESSPRRRTASQELAFVEQLLMADWRGRWGKPLTADELLITGRKAFEPLFHEFPIGPIPEYLVPHLSVYGCVAEDEEKLEELDRWKALGLGRWLKDRIGKNWCVAGKVYQLQTEKDEAVASEKFWFRLIEDRTECGKLTTTKINGKEARLDPLNFIHASERVKPMAQAKQDDTVRVHYRGTLGDGTVFSSTYEEKEPFEFTIGKGRVLPRFEKAVIGMNEGDIKTISVPPENAYGQHRKEFVFVMDRAQAPVTLKLELGKRLKIRTNQGTTAIATITAITADSVILDANDPLAGKTLNFEIELIEIL